MKLIPPAYPLSLPLRADPHLLHSRMILPPEMTRFAPARYLYPAHMRKAMR